MAGVLLPQVELADRDQVLLMLVRERFPEWIEIY